MGSGSSGGQAVMIIVWVALVVLAAGGFTAFSLLRRRRGQPTGADKTGREQ